MTERKKRWLKITGIVVVVILILSFTFNEIVSSIITNKVKEYLADHKPLKGYDIKFDRVGFNLLNSSVKLIGLEIIPDSAFIDSLVKSGYKNSYFSVSVKKFAVLGIEFKKLIKEKEVDIRKIRIKKPYVKIFNIKGKQKPVSVKQKKNEKIFSAIEDSVRIKGLNDLKIGMVEIRDGKFDIIQHKTGKLVITNGGIEILLEKLALTKSKHNNGYMYPSIKNASLLIENNKIKLDNNLYKVGFDKLTINFMDREIEVDNFIFKPLYSRRKFSKHIKRQQDMFDVKVSKINISEIDFKKLLIFNVLHIGKVDVSKASIKLFRDKKVPFDHSKRPLLPHQALKKMAFKMKIDSVRMTRSYFEYEQTAKKTKKPIHIHLSNIDALVTNINTVKTELNSKSKMIVEARALLMGKASVSVTIDFPLTAENDVFYFSAEVNKPFNLKILNEAVYPAAGMKFESGVLDKLTLHATGYPTFAHGRFKMLYHDLQMAAIDRDGVSTKKTLTWGVNKFVASSNPKKGKEPRQTVMFFERDMEKGFGNFFWKTIYSGLKGTIIPMFQKQTERRFRNFVKSQQEKNSSVPSKSGK
jgi:hypothetical protein